MYVIGVTGYSGTGKSTAAKKISEKFDNAKYIEGDYWMHKIPEQFKDLMIEVFGKEKVESIKNPGKMLGLIFQDTEKGKQIFQKAIPWIEEQFSQALKRAQEQGIEYAVCDWALLPALNLWKQSDMRVKVDTQTPEIRYNKLFERGLGNNKELIEQKTPEKKVTAFKSYKKRDDFVNAIIGEFNDDVEFLENDFDFQSLEEKVDSLYQLAVSRNKAKQNESSEQANNQPPKLNKQNVGKIAREEAVLKEIKHADEVYQEAEHSLELTPEAEK